MKDLLEYIVKSIVNDPDSVVITEKESVDFPGLIILSINVAETDKGIVIGRRGRTINAIRDLITISAIRNSARVKVQVEEGDRDRKPSRDTSSDEEKTSTEDMLDEEDKELEGLE